MASKYHYINTKELLQHLKMYLDYAEQGHTVYILRKSKIVAELKAAQYKEVVK